MSNKTFFISDLHLGHENMAKHRGFSSSIEHDEHLIEQWNSVVSKKDTVFILGDITMEKKDSYPLLNRLKGIKKVIMGNHDKPQHIDELKKYVNHCCGTMNYKGLILTHIPIHESCFEDRYKLNVHGHIHDYNLTDERYINVSADNVDYKPVCFVDLQKYAKPKVYTFTHKIISRDRKKIFLNQSVNFDHRPTFEELKDYIIGFDDKYNGFELKLYHILIQNKPGISKINKETRKIMHITCS